MLRRLLGCHRGGAGRRPPPPARRPTCHPSTPRSPTRSDRRPPGTARATAGSSTAPSRGPRCGPPPDGTVTFAGSVAGARHVTVLHADGMRTSYSFLAAGRGGGRAAGAPGRGAGHHRRTPAPRCTRGATPTSIPPRCSTGRARVRLVPFDEPPGRARAGSDERSGSCSAAWEGWSSRVGGVPVAVAGWLQEGGSQLVAPSATTAAGSRYPGAVLHAAATGWQAWQRARAVADRPCSAASASPSPPPGRRVALLVAGLGSNSRQATVDEVDTARSATTPADVVRFSYAGGRVPDPTDALAAIPARHYDAGRHAGRPAARLVATSPTWWRGWPPRPPASPSTSTPTRREGWWPGWPSSSSRLGTAERGCTTWACSPRWPPPTAGRTWPPPSTPCHGHRQRRPGPRCARDPHPPDGRRRRASGAPARRDLRRRGRAGPAARPGRLVAVSDRRPRRPDRARPPEPTPRAWTEVVLPLSGPSAHSDLPGSPGATRELELALAGLPPGCQTFARRPDRPGRGRGDQPRAGPGRSARRSCWLRPGRRAGRLTSAASIARRPGDRLVESHTHTLHPGHPAVALLGHRVGRQVRRRLPSRHSEPREGSPSWPSSP